jgi:hypothetical protein
VEVPKRPPSGSVDWLAMFRTKEGSTDQRFAVWRNIDGCQGSQGTKPVRIDETGSTMRPEIQGFEATAAFKPPTRTGFRPLQSS